MKLYNLVAIIASASAIKMEKEDSPSNAHSMATEFLTDALNIVGEVKTDTRSAEKEANEEHMKKIDEKIAELQKEI